MWEKKDSAKGNDTHVDISTRVTDDKKDLFSLDRKKERTERPTDTLNGTKKRSTLNYKLSQFPRLLIEQDENHQVL